MKTQFRKNKDWNPVKDLIILPSSFKVKTQFRKNKDWNKLVSSVLGHHVSVKTQFRKNKDWNVVTADPAAFDPIWWRPNSVRTRIET